ncbi:MAG: Hsp20/alpha crystallin family protein [Betaproteobacteria bacterium]
MLESLHNVGKEIGRELVQAWEHLSDGWRELLTRSGNALTRYTRKDEPTGGAAESDGAPSWGLIAGDILDDGRNIVVRVELPGIERDDCEVVVDGPALYIRGEKRYDRDYVSGSFYVRQCAYGRFERAIALPHHVDATRADAMYRSGVLTVKLPKATETAPRSIAIR